MGPWGFRGGAGGRTVHLYADFCINLQLFLHKVTCAHFHPAPHRWVYAGLFCEWEKATSRHTHTLDNQPSLAASCGRYYAVWRRGRHGMGHGSRGSNSSSFTPLNLLDFRK